MKSCYESYWIGRLSEFCNVSLFHAGRIFNDDGTSYTFGGYNCWHIVSRGRGYVISNGKRYSLERGDLFSVMEDSEIEYGSDTPEGWEFYYLRVEGPLAKSMTEKVGFSANSPVVHTDKKEVVISRFKEILAYAGEPENGLEFLTGQLLLLYQILTVSFTESRHLSAAEVVAESEKILRAPFTGNVNVNELASMLHISRGKLFASFKEIKGSSPLSIIQKVRLENICNLLKNSEIPLSELARKTAFQNEKYLIRFFKKYMGTTPGKYRRNMLK